MSAPRALIIRHVPAEGLAGYREPIEAAGYEVDRVDVADPGFSSLDLVEPDLLIMMGGPMGVYERERYPWIACQLRRLEKRLDAGRPTLGVCLGAQMIAQALGGEVFRGPVKEVGFHEVALRDVPDNPLGPVAATPVLHWHGDTFTLPGDVELLASSRLYDNQAFRRGNNILALQFHAEMGLDPRFEEWLDRWGDHVNEAGQDADDLRALYGVLGPPAVAAGQAMIAEWLKGLS